MHRWIQRTAALLLPLASGLAFQACMLAQEGEKKVGIDEVPAAVRAAILQKVGEGELVDIGMFTREGKRLYEIEMLVDGREHDVLFDANGKVLEASIEDGDGDEDDEDDADEDGEVDESTTAVQDEFFLDQRELVTTGRNRYFVLEPGYRLVLRGKDGSHDAELRITVLDETRRVGNFETRVVEERETVDGELVEVSRNFFAMCAQTKSVFYFGEEVDIYEGGEVVRHDGAWLHGQNGARAGMMLPGDPVIGAAFYQEIAPGVAMDRARIAAVNAALKTPAGAFRGCLKVREENPLDKEKEFKLHAPGIGLVKDEELVLVEHGFVK